MVQRREKNVTLFHVILQANHNFFFLASKFDFTRLSGIAKVVLVTWKFFSRGYKDCITGVDFSIAENVSFVNSLVSLYP